MLKEMHPKIYEFTDLKKALNYYRVMQEKLNTYTNKYSRLWYEVTLQSSNLTGIHLVTIHIGVQKSKDDFEWN
jgi:hypothetical protein